MYKGSNNKFIKKGGEKEKKKKKKGRKSNVKVGD